MKRILSLCLLLIASTVFGSSLSAAPTGINRNAQIAAFVDSLHIPGANEMLAQKMRDRKCGTGVNAYLHSLLPQIPFDRQQRLRQLLGITPYEKTRIIGHFEINYDTSNANQPALLDANGNRIPNTYEAYIDSVGKYFNYAWEYEIDTLGFLPPVFLPGHSAYRVEVRDFGGSEYGETDFDDQLNSSTTPEYWDTHIQIDNDFQDYYSQGIAGLRVTSAHEFQHSMQMSRYGFWEGQIFFYEMTAVWIESVVQPEVPDYIQYLESPDDAPRGTFLTPDVSFVTSDGLIEYSRVIWGKFIAKRYSRTMMRRIWEHVPNSPILGAINNALADSGSSFRNAFTEWSLWNYYTGSRADSVHYYDEARQFPEIARRDTFYYFSPSGFFIDSMQALGSVYHPSVLNGHDRIFTIISNVNAVAGNFSAKQYCTYRLADNGDASYKRLDSLVYVKLDVSDPVNWRSQESIPSAEILVPQTGDIVVYPNPYPDLRAGANSGITLRIPSALSNTATLHILSSSLREVYNSDLPVVLDLSSTPAIFWNAKTSSGDALASGVYFFIIEIDGKTYKGKFAVVQR